MLTDSLQILRMHYERQPFEVSFETLALCNAACTFCPYPTLTRRGASLSMDLITHLIGQMRTWAKPFYISPFKVNEPLLDVRLPEICAGIEAELPLAKIRLFTNGQPLTREALEWIGALKSLDKLWISLNSCDPNEYQTLMQLSYEKTAKRLDVLHDQVEQGHFRHAVAVSRVRGDELAGNAHFLNGVRSRWPLFTAFLIKRDGWLGHVEPSDPVIPHTACGRWFELNITAEGKAVLCCMADGSDPEHVQGDVTQQSLSDIYNQPVLLERRQKLSARQGIEPCQRCTY